MSEFYKQTPLHAVAAQAGAQFTDVDGWRLPQQFTSVEAEAAAARTGVALADLSANGKLTVEGHQLEALTEAVWRATAPAVGAGAAAGKAHLWRLRPDQLLVTTAPETAVETVTRLNRAAAALDGLLTVTDITHGRSELWLVGPQSVTLLGRLCGLNFGPAAFPNMAVRQSSVAKTAQIILRRDIGRTPAFALLGAASLGAYLWETVMQAGHDLGLAPLGRQAFLGL